MALDEGKGWLALIIGLVALALGLIPLLADFGVIGWNLPQFLLDIMTTFMLYFIIIIAIVLFIDSIWEDDMLRIVSMVVAVLIVVAGLIPILNSFGVIGFTIPLSQVFVSVLLMIEGIFLGIASVAMI